MRSYKVLEEYDKSISDDELKKIIIDKLYRIITTLEMNLEWKRSLGLQFI